MTKSEYMAVTLPMLEKWASTYRGVEAQMAVLRALMGAEVECPLPKAVYAMFDEYTAAVSRNVGDADGWLAWYCFDCAMGAAAKEVHWKWSGKKVKIKNLKQLAALLWECKP